MKKGNQSNPHFKIVNDDVYHYKLLIFIKFIKYHKWVFEWANKDRGLKSTLGQQSSVHYSLTSHKKFSLPHHPLQEKNWQRQHFFTILLHSRWTNVHIMGKWSQGLKIDLAATKQCTVLFNLTQEVFPAPPSSSSKNSLSRPFFHNFASFQVKKCPFYGQMVTGAKNRPRGNKAAESNF